MHSRVRALAGAAILGVGLAALPSGASARDGQLYAGVGAGLMLPEAPPFELAEGVAIIESESRLGWEGELVLGYDTGPLRLEIEGAYRRFGLSAVDGTLAGVPVLAPTGNDSGLRFAQLPITGGNIGSLSGMANVLLDFGGQNGLGFSIGGGAGLARPLYADLTTDRAGPGFLDDADTAFAWQMLGQVRVPVSSALQVALKYEYHRVEDTRLADQAGRGIDSHLATHSLMASVIVPLGRARPPAQPREATVPTPMSEVMAPSPPATPGPAS